MELCCVQLPNDVATCAPAVCHHSTQLLAPKAERKIWHWQWCLQRHIFNKASLATPKGNLCFGGVNSLNRFDPSELVPDRRNNTTLIEEVGVNSKALDWSLAEATHEIDALFSNEKETVFFSQKKMEFHTEHRSWWKRNSWWSGHEENQVSWVTSCLNA